jgi:predicted ester cyclase
MHPSAWKIDCAKFAYKEFLAARRGAFPDRRFVVEDMIAEGDKVSARFIMRDTHKNDFRVSPQVEER